MDNLEGTRLDVVEVEQLAFVIVVGVERFYGSLLLLACTHVRCLIRPLESKLRL